MLTFASTIVSLNVKNDDDDDDDIQTLCDNEIALPCHETRKTRWKRVLSIGEKVEM